jgi:predicted Zn-dependent protease
MAWERDAAWPSEFLKDKTSINAAVGPGSTDPCMHFRLYVTTGAFERLSRLELRGVLAHELAHVHLGHFGSAAARHQTREALDTLLATVGDIISAVPGIGLPVLVAVAGTQLVTSVGTDIFLRKFDRDDEAAADGFAAHLLLRVDGRLSCHRLADVFDRLASERDAGPQWLAHHPAPERRAERIRTLCREENRKADPRGVGRAAD